MTTQFCDLMIYQNDELEIETFPLNLYFKKTGNANPFKKESSESMSCCWNGYVASWAIEVDRLYLKKIQEIPSASENAPDLETVFPGHADGVFANWYSGEIKAPLSSEVMQGSDGKDVAVERTLKLGFQDGILISEDVILKYPLTLGEIESGLTSTDVSVRREFADPYADYTITPEQFERGMLDEDSGVRRLFMQASYRGRLRFPLTPEQLERALTDKDAGVRRFASLLFKNSKPTPFQLERGLKDKNRDVRNNFIQYFGDQLTPDQIERGLLDKNSEVRAAFAARCFQPTPVQISRGLTDENNTVRFWFVCNADVELSPEQIQIGLKDEDVMIQLEIASRYNCDLIEVPKLDPMLENFYLLNGTKVLKLGFEHDDERIVSWYRKAAEQGDAVGQRRLGWSYYNGRGVEQDREEAAKWFRRAAEQGDAKAQFNLGLMYKDGTGVPQDNEEAAKWYRLAADQGVD